MLGKKEVRAYIYAYTTYVRTQVGTETDKLEKDKNNNRLRWWQINLDTHTHTHTPRHAQKLFDCLLARLVPYYVA